MIQPEFTFGQAKVSRPQVFISETVTQPAWPPPHKFMTMYEDAVKKTRSIHTSISEAPSVSEPRTQPGWYRSPFSGKLMKEGFDAAMGRKTC